MGFRRTILPLHRPDDEGLTRAMAGIGMRFSAKPDAEANIEDTLLFASEEAMNGDDLRVLSVLVTWFGMHAPWVNADRLVRVARAHASVRVRALWSALGRWQSRDRRFVRLEQVYEGERLDLLSVGTDFQLQRRGEDARFDGSALRVPAGVLRDRQSDVSGPATLCRQHRAYRCRVMIGPSYRADMWAALEGDPELTAAQLARRAYGSFATAWQVRRDFALVHASGAARKPRRAAGEVERRPAPGVTEVTSAVEERA